MEGFPEHSNNIICCFTSREVREGWWATAVWNSKHLSSTYESHSIIKCTIECEHKTSDMVMFLIESFAIVILDVFIDWEFPLTHWSLPRTTLSLIASPSILKEELVYTTAIHHFIATWQAPVLTSQLHHAIAVNRQWHHTFRGMVNLRPSLIGALRYVAHTNLLLS